MSRSRNQLRAPQTRQDGGRPTARALLPERRAHAPRLFQKFLRRPFPAPHRRTLCPNEPFNPIAADEARLMDSGRACKPGMDGPSSLAAAPKDANALPSAPAIATDEAPASRFVPAGGISRADDAGGGRASAGQRLAGWPRSRRLLRRTDFLAVYEEGRRVAAPHFLIFSRFRASQMPSRFGITVSRKQGGAVLRNRLRRRTRELLRRHGTQLGRGWDVVVHPRAGVALAEWEVLDREIKELLERVRHRR